MAKKNSIVLILPAYNAEKTLIPFLAKLPKKIFSKIIFVDDCSSDNTYNVAKKQKGIVVYKTPSNLGYGGNLKYCLNLALKNGAEVIVELHPDGEYGTDGILPAIEKIKKGAGMVLGNRFAKNVKHPGMLFWKKPFIEGLTVIDNLILGTNVGDMHQGFRVYSSKLLENIPYKNDRDGYIFSFEIIAQAVYNGFKIGSVPVSTIYSGKKKGAKPIPAVIYSMQTFGVCIKYLLAKLGITSALFPAHKK